MQKWEIKETLNDRKSGHRSWNSIATVVCLSFLFFCLHFTLFFSRRMDDERWHFSIMYQTTILMWYDMHKRTACALYSNCFYPVNMRCNRNKLSDSKLKCDWIICCNIVWQPSAADAFKMCMHASLETQTARRRYAVERSPNNDIRKYFSLNFAQFHCYKVELLTFHFTFFGFVHWMHLRVCNMRSHYPL